MPRIMPRLARVTRVISWVIEHLNHSFFTRLRIHFSRVKRDSRVPVDPSFWDLKGVYYASFFTRVTRAYYVQIMYTLSS